MSRQTTLPFAIGRKPPAAPPPASGESSGRSDLPVRSNEAGSCTDAHNPAPSNDGRPLPSNKDLETVVATVPEEQPEAEEEEVEEELTALEQERLHIMATNQAFLAALNIPAAAVGFRPIHRRTQPRCRSSCQTNTSAAPESPTPKRLCTQRRAAVRARALISGRPEPPALEHEPAAAPTNEPCEDGTASHSIAEEEFAESSVHSYVCGGTDSGIPGNRSEPLQDLDALLGFSRGPVYATEVPRIYSLDVPPADAATPPLLLAAGHQGRVGVIGLVAGADSQRALLSFQAHTKWIGNALWLRDLCFLTAGSDDIVRVWDASQTGVRQGKPVLKAETRGLNYGSPLFCADVQRVPSGPCTLATGSRDGSIALAHIVDGGIRGGDPLAVHAGAVKCVKFRPMGVGLVLSTGNDATLQVTDLRNPDGALKFQDVHSGGAISCAWQGATDIVMSTGCDHVIKLWDLRGGDRCAPLHALKGHAGTTQRAKAIIHPATQLLYPPLFFAMEDWFV